MDAGHQLELSKKIATLAFVQMTGPMTNRALKIIVCAAAVTLMTCSAVRAQNSVGIYNSPRGFGASVQHDMDADHFCTFSLFTDIYGIPSGRTKSPGVHFCFSRNNILMQRSADDVTLSVYAGPGVSLGWGHDAEFTARSKEDLSNNPGITGAINGTAGVRAGFARNIALDLSFMCEVGLHIRNDEHLEQRDLTLYKNGLANIWMPQLLILWKF